MYRAHQRGDSSEEINTAIPGSPTNGNGPQRNKKAGQIKERGLLISQVEEYVHLMMMCLSQPNYLH
jgi:hypothetical protein